MAAIRPPIRRGLTGCAKGPWELALDEAWDAAAMNAPPPGVSLLRPPGDQRVAAIRFEISTVAKRAVRREAAGFT